MPTKVTIDNFQSVKHAEFDVEGFTVIVGQNNIGKSALVRALDKALTNAVGTSWIRKNEKVASVRILHGKDDIEWKKGEKTLYKVNGETFTALNRDIPQPMTDAGFGRMQVGDKMVNPILASQFKEIFLLDESGPTVTEVIADLYDLNVLNDADSDLQKDLKARKTLLKTRDADLKTARDNLTRYEGFEDVRKATDVMAALDEKCEVLRRQIAELAEYEMSTEAAKAAIARLKPAKSVKIPSAESVETLAGECSQLGEWEGEVTAMAKIVKALKPVHGVTVPDPAAAEALVGQAAEVAKYDSAVRNAEAAVGALSGAHSIDVSTPQAKAEGMEGLVTEIAVIKSSEQEFLTSARATKEVRDEVRKTAIELDSLQKEYDAIDVCPLCERPMHEHKDGK